ncbi:beta-ketoacyl synthase N-terminal-like domain-containing protein [Streptomyces rugosispiralis]|uniref:beta-ketoacyl synthase N-terminal-like domain-containing protein n=1 Tax=Streptomyces rugosispiralis TaxID=2967341 RepID=UPI00370471DA
MRPVEGGTSPCPHLRRTRRKKSSTQKFAIVGIKCRLPGARDVGKYWSNLKAGTRALPRGRWKT